MSSAKNKNFGLSHATFEELCEGLRKGEDQTLFEHIFIEHFEYCQQYLIREDQAPEHLAYDATMDALISFRNGLAKGSLRYGNLNWLLTRMARQHYYKLLRRPIPVDLNDMPELAEPEPAFEFSPELYAIFRHGWESLGEECRVLLRKIFYQDKSYQELAKNENKSQAVMRKRKQRCLIKLRKAVSFSLHPIVTKK
ncbi:MAG: RNA polymerase sigma factor [Lewinella sp.]